ncbi:MAG: N-acetyltransferase family protein [Halobacteriales archaeon]
MSEDRRYPDEPAGPFAAPPLTFEDGEGREVAVHRFGERLGDADAERAALAEMYGTFDPADRAQGIPPVGEAAIEGWLDRLLVADAVNVLAWHDDDIAGHATLVPDPDGAYELAIFVHQDYQGAGIGTRLIRALLGAGAAAGVERVWLTVERWNRPAVKLYEGVGFETTSTASFDLEMTLRLD